VSRARLAAGALALTLALAGAGCGRHGTFLGATLPSTCRDASSGSTAGERCIGWIFDRLGVIATDDEYESPALRAYVAGVAERVARANHLPVPTLRVVDRGTSPAFARPGGYVYVERQLLSILDNEAELAGVIAHELAHDAAGHTADLLDAFDADVDSMLRQARSRDDEATADERAVGYLAAAGYSPDALRTALIALDHAAAEPEPRPPVLPGDVILDGQHTSSPPEPDAVSGAAVQAEPPREVIIDDRHEFPHEIDWSDPTHPGMAERIARVTRVIDGRTAGELGAERYRDHVAGVVVGDDPRRGVLVGSTWSAARLGLAIDLPPGWQLDGDEARIDAAATKHAASMHALGRVWGDAVAETLSERRRMRVAGHQAVVGISRAPGDQNARRSELEVAMDSPRPDPGSAVGIVTVGRRALAVYITGAEPEHQLAFVLSRIRPMRPAELTAAVPARLAFHRAPTAGTLGDVVDAICAVPELSRTLADMTRAVAVGDAVKCVERK